MEFKHIKQIVDLVKRSGLTEFELEEKDFKLRLCRKSDEVQAIFQGGTPVPFNSTAMPFPATPAGGAEQASAAPEAAKEVDESKLIKSPMVGTFYSSPSPESPPFVAVGDSVSDDTVVCIVEAMKVMNEIKAEAKGSIAEILVENGDNIEYGQALFRLK
ncbi:acetyl-CoA carboxylase biotin carboxyl carrier protein [Puniceicoccales bacterium CK1056]|uniref:Biotin carboxyl carrier protein of acetyl-CoA carboxylase n=1 Tax=Oceanipulchritudo coccoides TaxID=2706888 RepID=A0A6B2M0W8_9BACT|nr:acetyl-CoA carboxylase biotin carboxyl carrier protein [Oceanipulchritudo coccoides]NDV62548.1 acetyl-CoA carboxylase biotin carboxyl carrier protein [Oceanipulchritudo coccoides]